MGAVVYVTMEHETSLNPLLHSVALMLHVQYMMIATN